MKTGIKVSFFLVFAITLVATISSPCKEQFSMASQEEFLYDSQNRRDPFTPLLKPGDLSKKPALSLEDVKLEGIVLDPSRGTFVMINGEVYQQGDSVGPYIIDKIEENRVLFKFEDKSYELKLEKEEERDLSRKVI